MISKNNQIKKSQKGKIRMTNNSNNLNNTDNVQNVEIETIFNNSDKYAKIHITKGAKLSRSIFAIIVGLFLCLTTIIASYSLSFANIQLFEFMSHLLIMIVYMTLSVIFIRYGFNNLTYRLRYIKVKKTAKKTNKSIQECYVEAIAMINNISKEDAYKALRRKSQYLKIQDKININNTIDI